jgi:hypothetical protein
VTSDELKQTSDELKQQIAAAFDIDPADMCLLEPTCEEVQLKYERKQHAAAVKHEQWATAVRLGALLPPGMTWVVE